jgi:CRP-like cAMP-binding protein
MDTFINFIKQYTELSAEAELDIRNSAEVESLEKGSQIVQQGKVCKKVFFLVEGTARTFFYQKGKDITHWIYPKEMLFTSWSSYFFKKPASEYIELTELSKLISLSSENWQVLYGKHPELERFGRVIAEQELAIIDDFYKGYYFLTAKEKYELLISVFPNVTQIANLGHIASMLGISQETLSRIRGK